MVRFFYSALAVILLVGFWALASCDSVKTLGMVVEDWETEDDPTDTGEDGPWYPSDTSTNSGSEGGNSSDGTDTVQNTGEGGETAQEEDASPGTVSTEQDQDAGNGEATDTSSTTG